MKPTSPLAELLRPQHLDEIIGQQHLLGQGKPLRIAFESGEPHSMIFWGPPGTGKTTLARLGANAFHCEWIALSAVFSGVKEIRAAIDQATRALEEKKRTLVFIDEIHRFNKAQQDALLPFTESGLITIIGATTENPSFEINSALLSRVQVYVLKPLSPEELKAVYERAKAKFLRQLEIEDAALNTLISFADGDARRLLNMLEQLDVALRKKRKKRVTPELLLNLLSKNVRRFDKGGEQFYDQISALHKSVRGSNPNAALYWFCRMLDGGADPRYLARRIIRMAWEDIGLADPRAMQLSQEAALTYERLGSPEGELALAQAVIYLAVAAKSNAGYIAFNKAMAYVKKDESREVPLHLRNAPTHLMKKLGYGKHYRYAHDEEEAFAAGEHYFPEGMSEMDWYQPVNRGLEQKIFAKLEHLKDLNEACRDQRKEVRDTERNQKINLPSQDKK